MTRPDTILQWLHTRPLQDNPGWAEPAGKETFASWDNWIDNGKMIPGIETGLARIVSDHEEDPVNRSAAALALGFLGGDSCIAILTAVLADGEPIVAMEAAASLGRIGKPESVGPLCRALKHPDANVRANAFMALGRIGGERALLCLKEAGQDKDSFVQVAANEAWRLINQA